MINEIMLPLLNGIVCNQQNDKHEDCCQNGKTYIIECRKQPGISTKMGKKTEISFLKNKKGKHRHHCTCT